MRTIPSEIAVFAALLTAACDKPKNDTPTTEDIPATEEDLTVVTSIESASGPSAENEYAISFAATDGTGASLGTTDLTFKIFAGTAALDAGPMLVDEDGGLSSFPVIDANATRIALTFERTYADGDSASLTLSLTPRTDGGSINLLDATDLVFDGSGSAFVAGVQAAVDLEEIFVDSGQGSFVTECSTAYPCHGTATATFEPSDLLDTYVGTKADSSAEVDYYGAITSSTMYFNDSAYPQVVYGVDMNKSPGGATKSELGKSDAKLLSQIIAGSKMSPGSEYEAAAIVDAQSDLTSWFAFTFISDLVSDSWKALGSVYTGTTEGLAALAQEFGEDLAKDMFEKLKKGQAETMERTGSDGKKITYVCYKGLQPPSADVVIEGKATIKHGNGTCEEVQYRIKCSVPVNAKCEPTVQPGTTVECTKEIISKTPLEPCGAGVCVDWNGEWQSLAGVRDVGDSGGLKSGAPPCGYLCDNAGDEKTVDIQSLSANPE